MKKYFRHIGLRYYLFSLVISLAPVTTSAQQSNTLFFMHSLPEANYVNPAVQIECGIFVGLPLLSSFHMNIANSGFSAGKFITLYTDGTYGRKLDFSTDKLAPRNYFVSEFHSTLLALGLKRDNNYYSFTITEKNESNVMYTPDLVAFSLRGSEEFEGQSVGLEGIRIRFNHYREFAFGISRKVNPNLLLGVKFKLLFGKFNIDTRNSTFNLAVEPGTRDIIFGIDGGYHSSLPRALREESPGIYRYYSQSDASLMKYLLNRRNPGFALDFGIIYKYNDRLTLSGSLLDIGMIFYRSNLSNYHLTGNHTYQGPFGNGAIDGTYLWDVFDELNQNMDEEITTGPYVYYLDPRLYLGVAYTLNKKLDINFLLYNRLLPSKLQTGMTVSLLTRAPGNWKTSLSWSYMNNSVANLGVGVAYGKKPVQLYLVSDNIMAFILPLSAKNVNLRLGINLNLGCREEFNINQCGCEWLRKAEDRRSRMEKFRRGKKR